MRFGDANPTVGVEDTIHNMLYEITGKLCGAVSIIDGGGKLLGLVTDYDVRRSLEQGRDIFSLGIADIMNKNPVYICSDEKAVDALGLMEDRETPFLVLPVLDRHSGVVVGMVHLHDLVAKGL